MKKKGKIIAKWNKISLLKKKIIVGVITLFLFLFLIFGAQIYLYINFLLGNDTLIELSVDKQKLSLTGGQEENVKFKVKITSNPFCEATCNYEFQDISNNIIIDKNKFNLKNNVPIIKQYKIKAKTREIGQDLYRFNIECKSKSTLLCHTKEQNVTRKILVTLDYTLNEEDKQYYERLKSQLENLSLRLEKLDKEVYYFEDANKKLETRIIFNETRLNDFENNTLEKHQKIESIKELWKRQEFFVIEEEIENINSDLNNTETLSHQINNTLLSKVQKYNYLINILNQTRMQLNQAKDYQLNETQILELNNLIKDFNDNIVSFKKISLIEEKETSVLLINKESSDFILGIEKSPGNSASLTILELNIDKITINENNTITKVDFGSPNEKCCVFEKCYDCCITGECKNSQKNYPIIFLHGHQFNKDLSVEFNIDSFADIQDNVENEGYLNLGAISSYDQEEIDSWSKIPSPYTIRISYYYDTLKQSGNYIIIQKKSESIDVYAIKLNELINEITERTGRPKVTIVSHSMGGLVARRYIQLFGTGKIDKLIMIATPNKGIEGSIADYCSLLGEKLECEDMKSTSLFMNKLNTGENPDIPIYMIAGDGCKRDGEDSDGIVLKRNAILEGANNFVITGTCNGVDLLHTQILDINKYPEVGKIIKETLNRTI